MHFGDSVGVVGQDPLASMGGIAKLRIDGYVVAYVLALYFLSVSQELCADHSTNLIYGHV
jgi:hypothetical protein